jgi:hypothetical protein
MKSRIFVVAMMTALLVMPATTALGADQDVDVQVFPANTLAIEVQDQLGFAMVVGQTNSQSFWMQVTNTTSGAWQVTVDGNDLASYDWTDCDEWGCYTRVPTDPLNTIPKSNVVVTGGDFCWSGEGCDPAADGLVTAYSQALSDLGPVLIMQGTAEAWGSFGFGPAPYEPTVELTIPADAATAMYWTTLTYTIMAP